MQRCKGCTVCGLPLPRYVTQGCCQNSGHALYIAEPDKIFTSSSQLSRACLVTAFPLATIFDPLTSFSGEAGGELAKLCWPTNLAG